MVDILAFRGKQWSSPRAPWSSTGARESPMIFTIFVDGILGSLISEWTAQGIGWSCDHLLMVCLAYADDVLLFADSLEMFNDCCASFERAGLVVGAEKSRWSSSMVLEGVTIRAGGHYVLWERTWTVVGCEMEPPGHSGAALAHRMVRANIGVSAWRPMLLNPDIPFCSKITGHTPHRVGQ